ncbi:TPA: ankyrin repeat domain-containing protein [Burkholderia vietnamiensis]|nr:ankyrin repeat domain-containing protein [Burkholderia vietnamiensis]
MANLRELFASVRNTFSRGVQQAPQDDDVDLSEPSIEASPTLEHQTPVHQRESLYDMVRENKLDELKAAFDQDADMSTTNLLHHVRSPEMVDFLVGKGANIDEPYVQNGPKTAEERAMSDLVGGDLDGFTPLMFAASTANIPTITRLLEHGADSTNALHCAVSVERQDEEAVARTMIAAGAGVDNGIVQFATDHGAQTGTIKALLDGGADPNGMNPDYGRGEAGTALQIAAHKGRMDVADLLLDYGADQMVRNVNGDTALHAAYEHPAMAELIISRSADPAASVNATDKMGNTPLTRAASEGKSDTAWKLLEHGADPALAIRGDAWREAELSQQSDISRTTERQTAMNLVRSRAVEQEKQALRQTVAEVEQDQTPDVAEQPAPRRRARL